MLKNLDLLNDRDLLLDLANEKTQRLEKQAKILKQNAKKAKKTFKRRRCIIWSVSITGILLIIVAIILMIVLWFKIF